MTDTRRVKRCIIIIIIIMVVVVVLAHADGCRRDCHGHGSCQLFSGTWLCRCHDGWKGSDCNVAMELDCDNRLDDDNGPCSSLTRCLY